MITLKQIANLWVITKKEVIVSHTSGNGGWRFLVFTNKKEAEHLANVWNNDNYDGNPICSVKKLIDCKY